MPFINCKDAGHNMVDFVSRIDRDRTYVRFDPAETEKSRDIIVCGLGEVELVPGQGKVPIAIATFEIAKDASGFFYYSGACDLERTTYSCSHGTRGNSPFGSGLAGVVGEMIEVVEQSNLPPEEKSPAITYLSELLSTYSALDEAASCDAA